MYKISGKYKPSLEERAWIHHIMDSLQEGGKLVTSLVVYQKKGKCLHLLVVNDAIAETGLSMFHVNMEVLKMQKLCEHEGYRLIDNRKEAWN